MGCVKELVKEQEQPLLSFGVISDVQYADIPDGRSFLGVPRYYRHSLLVLQRAVQKWNHQNLKFAINLGDIVDGFCPKDQSLSAVKKIVDEFNLFNGPVYHLIVLIYQIPTGPILQSVKKIVDEFNLFNGPIYHLIGNHCLYNLSREKLLPALNINPSRDDLTAYYDFSPIPEYRFVVLDGYDVSAIGWPKDHRNTLEALNILSKRNPNSNKNSPNGLLGRDKRFVMFNGGVGKDQIQWLDLVLQDATCLDQKVVICCHLPLDRDASSNETLLWNYEEVMDVIHRYECVKVCLAGHEHEGGHSVDSHGVHHRVLEAALECPPGTNAFGRVDLFRDRLVLFGTDRLKSREMVFR